MSSFGAKRKAKVIKVVDDDEPAAEPATASIGDATKAGEHSLIPLRDYY